MAEKLNPKAFAIALTIVTFILDLSGYVWHGMYGMPSIMGMMYPGFWGSWIMMLYGLIGTLVLAFVFGYLFAWLYNWAGKKYK